MQLHDSSKRKHGLNTILDLNIGLLGISEVKFNFCQQDVIKRYKFIYGREQDPQTLGGI